MIRFSYQREEKSIANRPLPILASADYLRQYLTQARQEMAARLIEKVYIDGKPSKWWLAFTKRRFMGKSLS
jgi:actin related protein 2/3 complex subunit 3